MLRPADLKRPSVSGFKAPHLPLALSVDQIFRVVSSEPLTSRWPVMVVTPVKTSTESPRIFQPFVPLETWEVLSLWG